MTLDEALRAEARVHFGADARVEALVPLTGGASRELYGFDVLAGAERHALVLRRDPPGLEEPEGAVARPATTRSRSRRTERPGRPGACGATRPASAGR